MNLVSNRFVCKFFGYFVIPLFRNVSNQFPEYFILG
jgi:hypothetical protein